MRLTALIIVPMKSEGEQNPSQISKLKWMITGLE
jgi:hypothetical protein